MRHSRQAASVRIYSIDLGKNLFHVAGLDAGGHTVLRGKFSGVHC